MKEVDLSAWDKYDQGPEPIVDQWPDPYDVMIDNQIEGERDMTTMKTVMVFIENGKFRFIRGKLSREFALDERVKILGNYMNMIALSQQGVSDEEMNREITIFLYEEIYKQRKNLSDLLDSIPVMYKPEAPQ